MRKLSRIGATALALALSVTFLTPTTAFAKTKVEDEALLERVENQHDDGVYDSNTIQLGKISATGATYAAAREAATTALHKAYIANGLTTTINPYPNGSGYASYFTENGVRYYYNAGYEDWDSDWDTTGTVCTYWFEGVHGTIYKNRISGKTAPFRTITDNNFSEDENISRQFVKGIRIKKGETTYLRVNLSGGDTTIKNIKSSKKKIATAKLYKKMSCEVSSNSDSATYKTNYNATTGAVESYTVYYYTTIGAKVVVGTYTTTEERDNALKTVNADSSSAVRYIELDAKKAGKSNLTFDIVNNNGAVSKVKTTVYVVDDMNVLKTFSLGGKSLLDDYSKSNNLNYGKREHDTLWNVYGKSKGKLVVKANANYQIKSIEVGKLYKTPYTEGLAGTDRWGKPYDRSATYSAYNETGVDTVHRADLNGDGDFDDVVDGMSESNVSFKYSKVKSGKTVKLSTIGYDYDSALSYTKKEEKNRKDQVITYSEKDTTRNLYAPTSIRITYFDKLTNTYDTIEKVVYIAVKK